MIFLKQTHRPLAIMDGCNKGCEINSALDTMGRFRCSREITITPPVLKKYSKYERMCGCNCSFIIEKEPFVEWMTATGTANKLNTFENRDNCKCLFQRKTVPLKILNHCKRPPEKMTVPFKCTDATASLKL